MTGRISPKRYHVLAILLHWVIAAALAFQLFLGWRLHGPKSPEIFALFQLHKSIGISILVLSLLRLALRFFLPRPASVAGPKWATALSKAVHAGFYGVMILGPITGWLIVSTSKTKVPTLLFGTIPWPHIPVADTMRHLVHEAAETGHSVIFWIGIALFALHVAGALRHQYLLRNPILERMIPGAKGKAIWAVIGAFALIAGFSLYGHYVRPQIAPAVAPLAPARIPAVPEPVIAAPVIPETTIPETLKEPVNWAVQPGGTLGFTASWNGQAVNGSFTKWRAAIKFSPDALDTSTIRVTIDPASANSNDSQRDESLRGSDFFDSAAHPKAVFTSNRITSLGGDTYRATGILTIKNVAKPTTLNFTLNIRDKRAKVRGTAQIDRTDFGVGTGEWASTDAIAARVDIRFQFTAVRD